jgi:hypothetical protein
MTDQISHPHKTTSKIIYSIASFLARKSRKEKVRNVTIRAIMEVGKNILKITEEKRLRWF